jgi:hypothetical protein
MVRYFFESPREQQQPEGTPALYRLYAIIDDLYYWKVEWHWNKQAREITVHMFNAGFISGEITASCSNLPVIDPSELRNRFGSFAYLIERAVNGFKSYIMWISPDPHASGLPWKISNA